MDGTWLVGLLVVFVAAPFAITSYVSARRSTAVDDGGRSATQAQRDLAPFPLRPHRRYHRRRVPRKLARNAISRARRGVGPPMFHSSRSRPTGGSPWPRP